MTVIFSSNIALASCSLRSGEKVEIGLKSYWLSVTLGFSEKHF